ncbi:hypothetical protein ABIB40_000610 [Pedobacter sp. UYP30]|uniref:DUF2490 domain-containing protein n=1 Tax=Pedobacter sp. UYP30 TaxID=1756400 RepID=UPI00339B6DFE
MKTLLAVCCVMMPFGLFAQTKSENSGWFSLSNSIKLNDKITAFADAQLRTENNWTFLKQVEVTTGLNYRFLPNQEIGFGGVLTNTRKSQIVHLKENDRRLFEQYTLKHSLWTAAVTHRFRLEQRFIETITDHNFFAQRLRYRFKAQQPLSNQQVKFSSGFYALVQDEVLLNIQNKEKLNNHFLDQNRLLLALGYRVSKNLDVDLGYLNDFSIGTNSDKDTHVLQLALSTKF